MMKFSTIVSLLLAFSRFCFSQSIQEIIRSLPLEYTPELTKSGKDSLITFGKYVIPHGDSIETVEYSIYFDTLNHAQLEYYFTTGQAGFITMELQLFKKRNGDTLVVFSRYGGARRAFQQQGLETFILVKGILIKTKIAELPIEIGPSDFLKKGTPEVIENSLCTSYNLRPEGIEGVEYFAYCQVSTCQVCLKTDSYVFKWNGITFERQKSQK